MTFSTPAAGSLLVSFWYGFQAGTAVVASLEVDAQTVSLPRTSVGAAAFSSLNPGVDNNGLSGSELDIFFSWTFNALEAGSHTLTFATSGGTRSDLKVDDLLLVTVVPEPTSAMLLLSGVVGLAFKARHRHRRS